MSFNKNFINFMEIINDLKDLEKKIYLDSPDIWIDFADKVAEKNLDEMVLFFATKYDYLSIVKFIIENKIVNLNNTSKNSEFTTIKEHLLKASTEFNAKDIYDFLMSFDENKSSQKDTNSTNSDINIEDLFKTVGEKISDFCGQLDINDTFGDSPTKKEESSPAEDKNTKKDVSDSVESTNTDTIDIEKKKESANNDKDAIDNNSEIKSCYEPKFICPNCSTNILETGYSSYEKVNYKYSKDEKGIKVVSREHTNSITCSKCNYTIEDLNPLFLENICTIQNCKKCGKDLTSTGIVSKSKTEYDTESNCFVTSKKSYHCGECDEELSNEQINYFRL